MNSLVEVGARRGRGDDGSMMPMALVIIAFLIVSFVSLVSASEAWAERRDTQAVAASAARAAAQPGVDEIVGVRDGEIIEKLLGKGGGGGRPRP